LAHRSGEGSSDRGRRMLALEGVAMSVDHHVLTPRHGDAKLNLKQTRAPVTHWRPADNHMATRDARADFFEASGLRGDLGSDLFGRLELPEGDVDGHLHCRLSRAGWAFSATIGRCR
jgi:hypothetical protein